MSKDLKLDTTLTLMIYINCIRVEAERALPSVIDSSFMRKATRAEESLIKILMMIKRLDDEITNGDGAKNEVCIKSNH